MFESNWYAPLLQQLAEVESSVADEDFKLWRDGRTLLRVELGLYLLERLNLANEPSSGIWAVLSGLPLPHSGLLNLSTTQKAMRAKARILLQYGGSIPWGWDLRRYAGLPERWRCFEFGAGDPGKQAAQRILDRYPKRIAAYENILAQPPEHTRRKAKRAGLGEVQIRIDVPGGQADYPVQLTRDLLATANASFEWVERATPPQIIRVTRSDLRDTAQKLDEAEERAGMAPRHWVKFVDDELRYAPVTAGQIAEDTGDDLVLEAISHVVGMVGSGKSTLMKLLAVHVALQQQRRVSLIVTDTASAMNLAHYFNQLFCIAAEDEPIAVAIVGRSQRPKHLAQVYASDIYRQTGEHWALRWLATTCPLQGLARDRLPRLRESGDEPCDDLHQAAASAVDHKATRVACPLFNVCPAQQLYRDMPHARIWITTAGAMGQARIPAQAEPRDIRLGELIYEASDLVVFDEVDLHQVWFDNLYAPEMVIVEVRGRGVLDRIDARMARQWINRRDLAENERRWLQAERNSVDACSHLLSRLARFRFLEKWVGGNYFMDYRLFYGIAWRAAQLFGMLAGEKPPLVVTPDWHKPTLAEKWSAHPVAVQAQAIFKRFQKGDPTAHRQPSQPPDFTDPDSALVAEVREQWAVSDLGRILIELMAEGGIVGQEVTFRRCEQWLKQYLLGDQAAAAELDMLGRKDRRSGSVDDLRELAIRLEFTLGLASLDYTMWIVISEWHNHPQFGSQRDEDDEEIYERVPADLAHVLPIPPTGGLFGFYYDKTDHNRSGDMPPGERANGVERRLSVFEHRNIGRSYVSGFDRLLADVDLQPGPKVLALSGTSYLPHSARWHFAVEPAGILKADAGSVEAIRRDTEFAFTPQYRITASGMEAILVSGTDNMLGNLRTAAELLATGDENTYGCLRYELTRLKKLGAQDSRRWHNRERLLLMVNSYDQAEEVARVVADCMAPLSDSARVYCVARPTPDSTDVEWGVIRHGRINTSDVQGFAETRAQILVAPTAAIGRGYNILAHTMHNDDVAALGAVYFLIRPMPVPGDSQESARALNHYLLTLCADPMCVGEKANFWAGKDTLDAQFWALRRAATRYLRGADQVYGYHSLIADPFRLWELAASTAGILIQTCGRLVRGGVPFHAYFVDGKWAPRSTANLGDSGPADDESSSLLVAVQKVLVDYASTPMGAALYGPLVDRLKQVRNLRGPFRSAISATNSPSPERE